MHSTPLWQHHPSTALLVISVGLGARSRKLHCGFGWTPTFNLADVSVRLWDFPDDRARDTERQRLPEADVEGLPERRRRLTKTGPVTDWRLPVRISPTQTLELESISFAPKRSEASPQAVVLVLERAAKVM